MAEHLKKPFKESLQDIKERMKEKRSQKWMKFGKINQFSAVKSKIPTKSSKQTISIQANNRALAQALQESKLKLKDAEDTILQLRKDYQDLKVQMFALQRNLRFMQAQGLVEVFYDLMKLNIISKVSHNLLNTIDLLGPACSAEVVINTTICIFSRGPLQCADGCDQVIPSGMEADSHRNGLAHSVSENGEGSDNAISFIKTVPEEGRRSDFPTLKLSCLDGNVSSLSEDAFGNVLPGGVSSRPRYSAMRNRHALCIGILDHREACDAMRELSQDSHEITLEESLEKCTTENINLDISQSNKNKVGSELVLTQIASEAAPVNLDSNSNLKKHRCKSRDSSQVKKKKQQKGKLEWPKTTSRQRPKKGQNKEASKETLDLLGGSNDAYNFHFEECVHVTPFRQKKVNDTDTGVDDKDNLSETDTSESSHMEEDSDDSLYEPCKNKKKRKSSMHEKDASPVCPRPRSKRCLTQQLHNEKEAESSKSSDKSIRQPSKPSRTHLCDVTNTASLLPGTGNAAIVPEAEGPQSPRRKRSCAMAVNYKEPSIAGKLRRGDPFTDTYFLNSPIFKQKKDAKRRSLKKAALPKYNEKFVGC
ncbi:SGO1 protein, partial [Centropus unirufus]|nr:SGO1 protein [Centropus unirufus]